MKKAFLLAAVLAVAHSAPLDNLKLRFKVSARDLAEKDTIGNIDPYAEIFATDEGQKDEVKLGQTTVLTDEGSNPDWGDVFELDFVRAKRQRLHIKVWDQDTGREDDSLGQAYIDVAEYVDKDQHVNVNLNKKGYVIISTVDPLPPKAPPPPQVVQTIPVVHPIHTVPVVQPVLIPTSPVSNQKPQHIVAPVTPVAPAPVVQPSSQKLRIKLSATGLDDKDVLGTSDPYVKVFSKVGSEPERLIQNTAKLSDTEDPVWPDIIEYEYDPSKKPMLHFLVLDDDNNRRDDELGDAWLDVNEFVQRNQDQSLSLTKGTLTVRKL